MLKIQYVDCLHQFEVYVHLLRFQLFCTVSLLQLFHVFISDDLLVLYEIIFEKQDI